MRPSRRDQRDLLALVTEEIPIGWFGEAVEIVAQAQREIQRPELRWGWAVNRVMHALHVSRSQAEFLAGGALRWYKTRWTADDEQA